MQRAFSRLRFAIALVAVLSWRAVRSDTQTQPRGESQPNLTTLLEGYRSLQPTARGIAVKQRDVRIGHLEISFGDGTIYPLRSPQGETLGLYFEGLARYTYRSEDPADRLVIEANVAHQTTAPIYYQHAVRDSFQRAVFFFAAPFLEDIEKVDPDLPGGATIVPGATRELSPSSRSDFDRIWKRVGLTYLAYDHLAAEARLEQGEHQYVYAEMDGARETLGYSFDRVDNFKERLFLFRKIQGIDLRFERLLSEQPVDGGEAVHPEPLLLRKAGIDIVTTDNRSATITSDETFEASRDGITIARLGLMNNRDPYHYDWNSKKNRLEVRRVTDGSGHDIPFSHRYEEILLQLPQTLRRGQTVDLHFETAGEILTAMNGKRWDNYFDLLYEHWYPQPFTRRSGGWAFTVKVKTRKPFMPIAAGATVSLRETEDSYELQTASSRPAAPVAVFAGTYRTLEQAFPDLTVRAHAYAHVPQSALDRLPGYAHQFLGFYERTLGPYPFGDLDIVEVPIRIDVPVFRAFGIAPPGIVLLSSEVFTDRADARGTALSRGINQRLAHEIAHQWFPHQARPASPRDDWLSESFAEYLSGLAIAEFRPDERDRLDFPALVSDWRFNAKSCRNAGSIETANMMSGEDADQKRTCLLYARGPLVLHMLRAMAGEKRFLAILRRYLEVANMGTVTTEDFRKAAEEVLGADLGWFFDDWYRKGGIPEIRVHYGVERSATGAFVLSGRIEQAAGSGFRRILIPIVLDYEGGRREARLVFQDEPVEEFRFELAEKPKRISVDPAQNNLASYR